MNTRPTILHLFGETPFLPEEVNFTIGKAQAAYNLQFSVDCENAGDANAHWDNYREERGTARPGRQCTPLCMGSG